MRIHFVFDNSASRLKFFENEVNILFGIVVKAKKSYKNRSSHQIISLKDGVLLQKQREI